MPGRGAVAHLVGQHRDADGLRGVAVLPVQVRRVLRHLLLRGEEEAGQRVRPPRHPPRHHARLRVRPHQVAAGRAGELAVWEWIRLVVVVVVVAAALLLLLLLLPSNLLAGICLVTCTRLYPTF